MKKDFVYQEDFGHKIWSALPIIVRVMYNIGCLLINRPIFIVDLPAMKAILNGIQADLPFTPLFFFSVTRYQLPMGVNPLFVIAWAASGDTRNLITE
ncbi:MAG: hypothetical protein V2A66_02620 [Pseudomonadota bacterium]